MLFTLLFVFLFMRLHCLCAHMFVCMAVCLGRLQILYAKSGASAIAAHDF